MEATIEAKIKEPFTREFLKIVNSIIRAKTEQDLRNNMKDYDKIYLGFNFLIHGFGANHMWVSEKESGERIIFVKF